MQKTGVLKVVASTGGLRLFSDKEGVWNNPAKDVTLEGLEHLKALKGKNVVIIFNDKGRYISCELSTADNKDIATYPTNEEKSAPEQVKSDYVKKDTMITRQTCLKVAGEVAKSNMFPMPAEGYKKLEHLAINILVLAEEFEKWVNRK